MKLIKLFKFATILLLFILNFNASLFAEGNMKLGSVEVHPRIGVAEEYDDNIFWEPSNEKQDWITILTPEIRFNLPFYGKRHLLSFDCYADLAWFNEYSSQNYQNYYVTGLLDLNFPEWHLNFKDRFLPLTSDRADIEFTDRVKRKENTFNALIGKEFNKLAFEAGYENYWINYDDNAYRDLNRMDHIGTLTGYVQIFPKTKALLEYNYANMGYYHDDIRNGNYNQIRTGLKGSITEKMTVIGKVGYQARHYDDPGEPDWNHLAAYVDLVEEFTERTVLSLNYTLTAQESTYSINNYYQINRIGAELRQNILTKFVAFIGGSYAEDDYPDVTTEGSQTAKREDKLWTATAGLRYNIRDWIYAEAEYDYRDRNSNLDNLKYIDNSVSLSVSAEF